MTVERRLVFGLDDIRAVTFECTQCKTRTTVRRESLREVSQTCNSCGTIWWVNTDLPSHVTTSGPAVMAFVQALITLNVQIREKKNTFCILFEIEDSRVS